MNLFIVLGGAAALAAGGLLATSGPNAVSNPTAAPAVAHRGAPVLVELYQSQGCSSCPPANANLNAIAGSPGIVALSFGVTYWDQLGWKDTFAKPQFTERQWDYARFNGRGNVATPQIWVNGRRTLVGNDRRELQSTIAAAQSSGPALSLLGGNVVVGQGRAPSGGADVWVARYDPRVVEVPIRAGENGGRTLPHRNVVRQLLTVGHWTGATKSFAVPASPQGLATAVFVQAGKGGPVLSSAKL